MQELVKLHAGSVGVVSELEHGSTFTVNIPLGAAHLPADRLGGSKTLISTGLRGEAYVDEVLRVVAANGHHVEILSDEVIASQIAAPEAAIVRPRILLADDNADMRDYVQTFAVRQVRSGSGCGW